MGLYVERSELTGKNGRPLLGVTDLSDEERDARLIALLRKAQGLADAQAKTKKVGTTTGIGDLTRYLSPDEQAEAHALMTESDPLKRLLDPDFKRVTWEYEFSRSGLSIPGQLHPKQTE